MTPAARKLFLLVCVAAGLAAITASLIFAPDRVARKLHTTAPAGISPGAPTSTTPPARLPDTTLPASIR